MGVYESLIEGGKLTLGRGAELCLVSPLLGLAEVGGCCGKLENFEKSAYVPSKKEPAPPERGTIFLFYHIFDSWMENKI